MYKCVFFLGLKTNVRFRHGGYRYTVAGDPVFADSSAMSPFKGHVSDGNRLRRLEKSTWFEVR